MLKKNPLSWLSFPAASFAALLSFYIAIELYALIHTLPSHDELGYIIKSWWLVSGKTDWYSADTPLWYLPVTYLNPGLSQLSFGHGIIPARLFGLLSGLMCLSLTFIYLTRLFDAFTGLIGSSMLALSLAASGWYTAETYSLSGLLLICFLIAASDRFNFRLSTRILIISICLTTLVFTRLNHIISVVLLMPALSLSNRKQAFSQTLGVVVVTLALILLILKLMPANFFWQPTTLGIARAITNLFPLLWPIPHPEISSPAFFLGPSLTDQPSGLSIELQHGLSSLWINLIQLLPNLFYKFGAIILGIFLIPFTRKSHFHSKLTVYLGISFLIFVLISFLKGSTYCTTCPIRYSSYFLIPGVIAAAPTLMFLVSALTHLNLNTKMTVSMLCVGSMFMALVHHQDIWQQHYFSPRLKHELAQLSDTLNDRIPPDEPVLPIGSLKHYPIITGIFYSGRTVPSPLLNATFSFRAVGLLTPLTEEEYYANQIRGYWTEQHLVRWTKDHYDYLIKPTWLHYDDHPKKYWFRNVYYPVALRELISEHFDCIRMPGTYHEIPELDFCVRKAGPTS